MMRKIFSLMCLSAVCLFTHGQHGDTLFQRFQSPPSTAKPRVWWHWMNGNITKEGIRKDLLWMHRAGIGGFQNFDAAMETPQIVPNRLVYMTPEWKDAFACATRLADSLKLEMAIAGSPGWSESGGSWVPKEDGMKKLVWSETLVESGASGIPLARAAASSGTFQNIPLNDGLTNQGGSMPAYYRDVAVIAVPVAAREQSMLSLQPELNSSGGAFDLYQLADGDLEKGMVLPADTATGFGWISFAFDHPVMISAVTIAGGGDRGFMNANGDLKASRAFEVSEDGIAFRHVAWLPAGEVPQQTIAVPPVTARFFRIRFKNLPGSRQDLHPGTMVQELVLHTGSRIHRYEDKAAFAPAPGLLNESTPAATDAIPISGVIDLTRQLSKDGILHWTAPAGKWRILRFGYTVMGITNHPATAEATGFEVDKMDPVAVKRYFTHYLDMYRNATAGLMGEKGGLQYLVTDSWEAGAQNWTAKMPEQFFHRRGYSMIPWMPVLAGVVISNAASSDRFLFDFRKTISEMTSEYHYDQLTDILAVYGMKRYSESHESGRALIADGMEVKRRSAVPMSAMWTKHPYFNRNDQTSYEADIRESASVAHIYGQNLVAAESLTTFGYGGYAWSWSPESLKPTADLELANGLNRFVIHCSPHQPLDDKIPGLGLGPFGQWFDRHDTWAEQARVWSDYLSRSSYLLQQGKFVADIAYYYGEDDNITSLFKTKLPAIPEGYQYDFVNSDILLNLLSVKDGKLVTPSGMSYRMLVLDSNARRIPLKVLKKMQQLIKAGAIIAGVKPAHSTGLMDDENEFQHIVSESWNSPNVFTGQCTDDVLKTCAAEPDFTYPKPTPQTRLLYVHRKLADGDIYWINSRNSTSQDMEVSFRITGKQPELWYAETGKREAVSYRITKGRTYVNLKLAPNDAVFVIFAGKAKQQRVTLPAVVPHPLMQLEGPWEVCFQQERGAPANVTFDTLISYPQSADAGVKYFSGTATYRKMFELDAAQISSGRSIVLDLGEVKNIAEVEVNGVAVGTLWKRPFISGISAALKPGLNELVIRVTNLWVNRLIGDEQPGVTQKITYTTQPFYQANSPLLPSGLLGPVKLLSE